MAKTHEEYLIYMSEYNKKYREKYREKLIQKSRDHRKKQKGLKVVDEAERKENREALIKHAQSFMKNK